MSNQKMKILLVQVRNRNMGDAVINANARFLIRKALGLFGRNKCEIVDFDLGFTDDLSALQGVDGIIFAGGNLIRYTLRAYDRQIEAVLAEADRLNIPVFFHAVGVDGYDETDVRCQDLKAALRRDCVKEISCRDDIGVLAKDYLAGSSVAAVPVLNPAVWTADTFKSIANAPGGGTVGLGIARSDMFTAYGIDDVDHDFLLSFWKGVAAELERRGYNWTIFTSGPDEDEEFAVEVLEAIGHGTKLPAPETAEQFVRNIRSFGSLIGCRLHANVVAYSMGIPSVGLVWNDKLTLWGHIIGHPERFIQPEMFDPDYIVNVLERAIQTGCDPITKEEKNSAYLELKKFLQACQNK